MEFKLSEIVAQLGGLLIGEDVSIRKLSSLANANQGDISFIADTKYLKALSDTRASAIIVSSENLAATDLPKIVTDNPYAYFAQLSSLLNPEKLILSGIEASALIDSTAKVSASASIGANVVVRANVSIGDYVIIESGCVIAENVLIGEGSHLKPNVVVYHDCQIGNNCNIAAGVVIGADGFGYANQAGKWVKIPQVGRVIIGNNVDVGANTSIDRGALDDTIVEDGVKLDNLIQVGHNCVIGEHTVIAGCVGIAGSAKIGKRCRVGGAAMILGHLEIADDVTISPGSMITRSIKKTDTYTALMPFQAHADWLKTAAHIRQLGDLVARIKQLEHQVTALTALK
jgi:UDP-3-O-[3-hydroxymyristoyl] glucosamine N-acyltransferase